MEDGIKRRLQIVLILPPQAHGAMERIAMGGTQAKMITALGRIASSHGHDVGVYYTVPDGVGETWDSTYIHSKLLLVDDRFLSVGSANTNNRSMGMDTELNVSFEGQDEDFVRSLREMRTSLLAEHTGLRGEEAAWLQGIEGLVEQLDHATGSSRLRRLSVVDFMGPTWIDENVADLPLDPEGPLVEENAFEVVSALEKGWFVKGIADMGDRLLGNGVPTSSKRLPQPFRWLRSRRTLFLLAASLLTGLAFLWSMAR
jgi:hypothetical protein